MARRYGRWSGRPDGYPENVEYCAAQIRKGFIGQQCSRRRGHGPDGEFCRQHAKQIEQGIYVDIPCDQDKE